MEGPTQFLKSHEKKSMWNAKAGQCSPRHWETGQIFFTCKLRLIKMLTSPSLKTQFCLPIQIPIFSKPRRPISILSIWYNCSCQHYRFSYRWVEFITEAIYHNGVGTWAQHTHTRAHTQPQFNHGKSYQTNLSEGAFYKPFDQYSLKVSRWKINK